MKTDDFAVVKEALAWVGHPLVPAEMCRITTAGRNALSRLQQQAQEQSAEIARLQVLVAEAAKVTHYIVGVSGDSIKDYLRDDIASLHAKLTATGTAEEKPEAPNTHSVFDVWRCSSCGCSQLEALDPRWRWTGEAWEHKCGDPQAGYFPARNFGTPNDADMATWAKPEAPATECACRKALDVAKTVLEPIAGSYDLESEQELFEVESVHIQAAAMAFLEIKALTAPCPCEALRERLGFAGIAERSLRNQLLSTMEACDKLRAELAAANERAEKVPDGDDWKKLVALAYADGGDGARRIQAITTDYCRMRDQRDAARKELEIAVEAISRTQFALAEYIAWSGAVHQRGCPEDDTCACKGKPVNDAINAVYKDNAAIVSRFDAQGGKV